MIFEETAMVQRWLEHKWPRACVYCHCFLSVSLCSVYSFENPSSELALAHCSTRRSVRSTKAAIHSPVSIITTRLLITRNPLPPSSNCPVQTVGWPVGGCLGEKFASADLCSWRLPRSWRLSPCPTVKWTAEAERCSYLGCRVWTQRSDVKETQETGWGKVTLEPFYHMSTVADFSLRAILTRPSLGWQPRTAPVSHVIIVTLKPRMNPYYSPCAC